MTRRAGRLPIVGAIAAVTAGCASLRLHDQGRADIAQEALDLSKEIAGQENNVFDLMQENVSAVADTRKKAQEQLNDLRFDSFMFAVSDMTAEDVLDELTSALGEHRSAMNAMAGSVESATRQVAESLARQKTISSIVDADHDVRRGSIEDVIGSIDKRLDWLETNLGRLESAIRAAAGDAAPAGLADDQGAAAPAGDGKAAIPEITVRIESARKALAAPKDDPQVEAAQRLLLRAGQEFTLLEQQRLIEFRRHLAALERIQAVMNARDTEYMDNLMLPALAAVNADTAVAEYNARSGEALPDEDIRSVRAHTALWQDDGGGERTFAEYLQSALDADAVQDHGQKAVELAQNLALILFVEQYGDDEAALSIETEQHRHSIHLSEVNLAEQLDLVHQVSEALQIYYRGGIRPEELAETVILASQVASLLFIGAEL